MNKNLFTYKKSGVNIDAADKFVSFISSISSKKRGNKKNANIGGFGSVTDLPKDIKWHMVGHVQSNKIKYMAPYVDLIHGIDSLKSIKIINKEGVKNNRVINCLLQLKISKEESKFGLDEKQLKEIIFSTDYKEMNNIKIKGMMAMASNTKNESTIKKEFVFAKKIFNEINSLDNDFDILSMGMSNDYQIAIECGSNMIRLGSLIFGERNY